MGISIMPCPFCGSHRLQLVENILTHCVSCEACKAQGPHCRRTEDSVAEWNNVSKTIETMALTKEHFLHSHLTKRKILENSN